jgi:hypothetical protein
MPSLQSMEETKSNSSAYVKSQYPSMKKHRDGRAYHEATWEQTTTKPAVDVMKIQSFLSTTTEYAVKLTI